MRKCIWWVRDCGCGHTHLILFSPNKGVHVHCDRISACECECVCAKKNTLNGDETDTNAGSQICTKRARVKKNTRTEQSAERRKCASTNLKKERKLLAMIEPTHRMFTITCALRRANTHSFSWLCVDSSAFLFRRFFALTLFFLSLLSLLLVCYSIAAFHPPAQFLAVSLWALLQQFYSLRWFVRNLSPMSAIKKKKKKISAKRALEKWNKENDSQNQCLANESEKLYSKRTSIEPFYVHGLRKETANALFCWFVVFIFCSRFVFFFSLWSCYFVF